MTEVIKVVILAVIQGVAEFLPISSSGHLALMGHFLDVNENGMVTVSIILHAGTLLAILLFYFGKLKVIMFERQWKIIISVVVGSIPVVCVGVALKLTGIADVLFHTLLFPGIGLLFTSFLLLVFMGGHSEENTQDLSTVSLRKAIFIGCSQALAIWPGVSRSGSTIAIAIRLGIKKEDAATFSFLLAIPAIAGATLLELLSLLAGHNGGFSSLDYGVLTLGFAVSFGVGYLSLFLLLEILKKDRLKIFGYYCLCMGIVSTIMWGIS